MDEKEVDSNEFYDSKSSRFYPFYKTTLFVENSQYQNFSDSVRYHIQIFQNLGGVVLCTQQRRTATPSIPLDMYSESDLLKKQKEIYLTISRGDKNKKFITLNDFFQLVEEKKVDYVLSEIYTFYQVENEYTFTILPTLYDYQSVPSGIDFAKRRLSNVKKKRIPDTINYFGGTIPKWCFLADVGRELVSFGKYLSFLMNDTKTSSIRTFFSAFEHLIDFFRTSHPQCNPVRSEHPKLHNPLQTTPLILNFSHFPIFVVDFASGSTHDLRAEHSFVKLMGGLFALSHDQGGLEVLNGVLITESNLLWVQVRRVRSVKVKKEEVGGEEKVREEEEEGEEGEEDQEREKFTFQFRVRRLVSCIPQSREYQSIRKLMNSIINDIVFRIYTVRNTYFQRDIIKYIESRFGISDGLEARWFRLKNLYSIKFTEILYRTNLSVLFLAKKIADQQTGHPSNSKNNKKKNIEEDMVVKVCPLNINSYTEKRILIEIGSSKIKYIPYSEYLQVDNYLLLFMERLSHIRHHHLKNDWTEKLRVMMEALKCVKCFHDNHILLNDLKTDHFMFRKYRNNNNNNPNDSKSFIVSEDKKQQLMIIDFNLSLFFKEEVKDVVTGEEYLIDHQNKKIINTEGTEFFSGDEKKSLVGNVSTKTDVYSMGMILLQMFFSVESAESFLKMKELFENKKYYRLYSFFDDQHSQKISSKTSTPSKNSEASSISLKTDRVKEFVDYVILMTKKKKEDRIGMDEAISKFGELREKILGDLKIERKSKTTSSPPPSTSTSDRAESNSEGDIGGNDTDSTMTTTTGSTTTTTSTEEDQQENDNVQTSYYGVSVHDLEAEDDEEEMDTTGYWCL